jgi:hypothetical protein
MKVIKLLLFLSPLVLLSQQKFNTIREQLIKDKTYEYVSNFENNYAVFRTFKGTMGVIDSTGNIIIKPGFEYIYNKPELKNLFEVGTPIAKKFKRGFIDLKGNIKIPLEYDDVFYLEKGLISVSKNNKKGIIDTLNHVILPIKFDYIMNDNGVLFVQNSNNLDLFDFEGKQITNFKAKDIEYFTNDKTIVTLQNNDSFISNNQGAVILNSIKNHKFERIINSDTYIIFNLLTKKKGVINSTGKYEVECNYDDILPSKSFYIVKNKDKYGFVTKTDSILKPTIYNDISEVNYKNDILFQNQYIVTKVDLKGVINPYSENEIIPIRYKNIQTLSNYYIVQNLENKNGLFSEKGEAIISENYKFYNASLNKIFATKDSKKYLITVVDKNYSEIEIPVDAFVKDNLFSVGITNSKYQIFKSKNKTGVISNENKIVIPCEYDSIKDISSTSEFVVQKNKKYGIVNAQNQVIVDLKYDSFKFMKESISFEIKNSKNKKVHTINYSPQ